MQKNRVRKRFGILDSDTHLKSATIAATLGYCTMIEQFETHDGVSYHVVKHLLFFLNPVRQPSYTYTNPPFPEICSLFITIVHFVMNTQTYAAEEKKRKRGMNVR